MKTLLLLLVTTGGACAAAQPAVRCEDAVRLQPGLQDVTVSQHGKLPHGVQRMVFEHERPDVAACFPTVTQPHGVEVAVAVDARGVLLEARVVKALRADETAVACVEDVLRRVNYPSPVGGPARYAHVYAFCDDGKRS